MRPERRATARVAALIAFAVLAPEVGTASIWVETRDAGRSLAEAQITAGSGSLEAIFGNLDENAPDTGTSIDLFRIRVVDPFQFSAGTVAAPGFYVEDPQLFLFNSLGQAVYMNDDDESGLNGSQSLLPTAHPFGPPSVGLYYLAIGWFDNEPLSTLGLMFSGVSANGTNGPGVGGASPLTGWNDNVSLRIDIPTAYEIGLTGAAFAIPEPATGLLVAVPFAALALCRYFRRSR